MLGFLQNFNGDNMLLEMRDSRVVRFVVEKAIEIAMLGLPEQFNAICRVLATYDQLKTTEERLDFQLIWKYSGLDPPDLNRTSDDAVWVISDEVLKMKSHDARKRFHNLPQWFKWDDPNIINEDTIKRLEQHIEAAALRARPPGSHRMAAEYAAIIAIAYDLDLPQVINKHMPTILRRIHVPQQAQYLAQIPEVWRDYLLPGRLREVLDVSEGAVETFSHYVRDIADKRFRHGPFRPEEQYPGYGIPQLIEVIDRNTISDEKYEHIDYNQDSREGKLGDKTVLRQPATNEQITEAEARLGRKLPEDIKEFYRCTNGCTRIRVGESSFLSALPPLEDIFLEQGAYMDDYGFNLLPFLPNALYHKMNWPGMPNGGIAMYEHDGQGTQYVWLLDAEDIKTAKDRLEKAYKVVSNEERALIDQTIVYWFGSREAFDACQDHCYYEVHWGDEAQGIYSTFKAFLASVAVQSEHFVDRSPVKVPAGYVIS